MKKILFALTAAFCVAAQANAAITYSSDTRAVSAAEIANGAPEGTVYRYYVTTSADILSVGSFKFDVDKAIYNNAFGTNNAKPNDLLIPTFPALAVDSYVDTPGNTSILGVDLPGDGSANTGFGDLSDDGAVTNFQFAQFTVPTGAKGTFYGNIAIAGGESQNFSFGVGAIVPEPATMALAGVGLIGLVAARRRRA